MPDTASGGTGGQLPSGAGVPNGGAGGAAAENPVTSSGGVAIDGRQVVVDGAPYQVRGVCWNPVPVGGVHPADLDYAGFAEHDIPLMVTAGINTVRTYEPLTDIVVLDQLSAAGIRVMSTVYPYGGNDPTTAVDNVEPVKDHPAILLWVLGNEWNYNGLYVDMSHDDSVARLNEVAALVKGADATHPIITIYGGMPDQTVVEQMPDIDVWGINYYGGLSFGDSFAQWTSQSTKPLVMTEYGADAYDATAGQYDPLAQAEATRALTQLLFDNSSAQDPTKACAGGTIFEWADEWWKDGAGAPDVQDVGGIAPGGGPHPDQTFNEEYWGIVDIDRVPRPAYDVLVEMYGGGE